MSVKNDWNERPYFAAYNNKVKLEIDEDLMNN